MKSVIYILYRLKLTSDVPCVNERQTKIIKTHFAVDTMAPESNAFVNCIELSLFTSKIVLKI